VTFSVAGRLLGRPEGPEGVACRVKQNATTANREASHDSQRCPEPREASVSRSRGLAKLRVAHYARIRTSRVYKDR